MADKISHFEIPVNDLEVAKRFYGECFGWKFTKAPMPGPEYWLINTGSKEVGGGMYKKGEPNQAPVNYVSVKSLDASLTKFTQSGGKLLMPKQEVPNTGWIAVGADPEGNPIGFWQASPKRTVRRRTSKRKRK